jgi:hypothetical protein
MRVRDYAPDEAVDNTAAMGALAEVRARPRGARG